MKEKNEPLIVALDEIAQIGSASRVHYALTMHPKGLTLEDIAEITGFSRGTLSSHAIPRLLHTQLVKREKTPAGKIFRFTNGYLSRLLEAATEQKQKQLYPKCQ